MTAKPFPNWYAPSSSCAKVATSCSLKDAAPFLGLQTFTEQRDEDGVLDCTTGTEGSQVRV